MTGLVKWFNSDAGYGYIDGMNGVEYYVHYTSIKKRPQRLTAGQKVSFIESSSACKTPEANEVMIIG